VSSSTLESLFGEGFEFADDAQDNLEYAEVIVNWMESQN
jgi:hypothetical protein